MLVYIYRRDFKHFNVCFSLQMKIGFGIDCKNMEIHVGNDFEVQNFVVLVRNSANVKFFRF